MQILGDTNLLVSLVLASTTRCSAVENFRSFFLAIARRQPGENAYRRAIFDDVRETRSSEKWRTSGTRDGAEREISGLSMAVISLMVVSAYFSSAALDVSLSKLPLDIPIVETMAELFSLSLSPSALLLRVMGVTYRGMKSLRQFPHRNRTSYDIIHGFREIKCKFLLYRYFRPGGRRFYILCTVILLCSVPSADSYSAFLQYAL